MAKNDKTPRLRFKGFTEAWEQRKLGNIAFKVTEKNVSNTIKETFTNSAEMGVVSQRDFFDHDIAKADRIDGYYVVENDDFVYNPRISVTAPCGPINRNKLGRKGVMSPLYTVFRIDGINPLFLEWYFKTSCWYAYMYFNGDSGARSDRFSIKNELFFDMPIPTPIEKEQERIGMLLESINNLITLHQRKEFAKIVSKSSDYSDAKKHQNPFLWEQRELGKIGSTYTGLSGKSKSDFGHGKGKFITYMNVFTNPIANLGTVEPIEIDNKQNAVLVGDVFFTTSSETPDEVGMSCVLTENSPNTYLNSFCFGYRPTIKFDNYYLAYMLRSASFRAKITFLAQGISRYNISKNKVMEIEIPIPEFDEQQKIGAYFRNIDNLITLHQRGG